MSRLQSISVIIPAYNEEDNIGLMLKKIGKALDDSELDYEIIVVDDGSIENTLSCVKYLANNGDKIKVLRHQRREGKSAALRTGFSHAEGDIIVMIDADLQYDPKEIGVFVRALEEGYDVVNGWKDYSKYPLRRRIVSNIYNCLTKRLLGGRVHDLNCGFKAFRPYVLENVIDEFGWSKGIHRFLISLCYVLGYRIGEIKVSLHPRTNGKSKYGLERLLEGLLLLLFLTLKVKVIQRGNFTVKRNAL